MCESDIKNMIKKIEKGGAMLCTIREEESVCGIRFVDSEGKSCEDREVVMDFGNGNYYEVERIDGEISDFVHFDYHLEDDEDETVATALGYFYALSESNGMEIERSEGKLCGEYPNGDSKVGIKVKYADDYIEYDYMVVVPVEGKPYLK